MENYQLQIWNKFCERQKVRENGVDLFAGEEIVNTIGIGRDGRLILCRSIAMNHLIISEVEQVLEDFQNDTRIYDGLIYMMYRENQGQIIPLYIGKSEKYGRENGNLSANIANIGNNFGKFCRWGNNYKYHIGNLSAVVLGHDEIKQKRNYKNWASALFKIYPTNEPKLKFPVKFWIKAWRSDEVGIWEEFGPTSLSFL